MGRLLELGATLPQVALAGSMSTPGEQGGAMETVPRFTSADLEALPDDGKRYEIIDGELYVSKAPSWKHQVVCMGIGAPLDQWDRSTGLGVVVGGPGIIFADDDDVIPDLVWISHERLAVALE